jgi:hypothetical protein
MDDLKVSRVGWVVGGPSGFSMGLGGCDTSGTGLDLVTRSSGNTGTVDIGCLSALHVGVHFKGDGRWVRGSTTSISNHSWGTATDIKINGVLDALSHVAFGNRPNVAQWFRLPYRAVGLNRA